MKKNILLFTITLLTNIITYNYTNDTITKKYSSIINNCFSVDNSIDSNILVELVKKNKGFVCNIINKSECFSIRNVILEVEYFKKSKKDTLTLNMLEKISPKYDASVYVNDIDVDSLKLINYSIKTFELN